MRCCISTTSSHRPNLRPTSRSTPTSSKPQARCRAIDASWPPDDPGHHGVKAVGAGQPDQLLEQAPADPLALAVGVHVDRVLDRGAIGRPGSVRRQRAEPADAFVIVDGHDGRVGAAVLVHPGQLVLGGCGAPCRR